MRTMIKGKSIWPILLIIPLLWHGMASRVEACPGCWAGYGPGAERLNKPLADLRIIYEKEGRNALPYIRKALITSTDPLVMRRAATYIVELKDTESIPLMEDMLHALVKRVAFSKFGLGTYDFQGRLAVAHALINFGPSTIVDRIWERYDRLDLDRKSEVPYILNGLKDPKLDERLLEIVNREEDHQLMMGALDVLSFGGSTKALPALRSKVAEWRDKSTKLSANPHPDGPVLYYVPLRIKAEKAISAIEERSTKTDSALSG
jgi:hypothetical protein